MDAQIKKAKILFFVDGPAPTPEDFKAAGKLNGVVMFRNARHVPNEPHSLEMCDGVAGGPIFDADGEVVEGKTHLPEIYADRFPSAEEAIAKKQRELDELAEKVGDTKAPKSKKQENGGRGSSWTPNKQA